MLRRWAEAETNNSWNIYQRCNFFIHLSTVTYLKAGPKPNIRLLQICIVKNLNCFLLEEKHLWTDVNFILLNKKAFAQLTTLWSGLGKFYVAKNVLPLSKTAMRIVMLKGFYFVNGRMFFVLSLEITVSWYMKTTTLLKISLNLSELLTWNFFLNYLSKVFFTYFCFTD